MLSNEIWKPIKNYEKYYLVSNYGRIKALERDKKCNTGYMKTKERIMKPNCCNTEYERVGLVDDNHIRKYYLIHRLVAEAFIPNENNFTEVNHIDGDKHNNKSENLEWCNRSYNLKHAYENGLRPTIKQLCGEIENLKEEIKNIKENNCYKIGDEKND